jgi:arginyl-tRNA synthetase
MSEVAPPDKQQALRLNLIMAENDHDEANAKVATRLSKLGIGPILLGLPPLAPSINPIDIYRLYIANAIAHVAGVDEKVALSSLEWTTSPDKGDLVLPCPRLKVKGTNPTDLARKIAAEVRPIIHPRTKKVADKLYLASRAPALREG